MKKEFIVNQFKLAAVDYRLAKSAADRQSAIDQMYEWQRTAGELYGLEFADTLDAYKPDVKGV